MQLRPVRALASGAISAALILGLTVLPVSAATSSQNIQVDYKSITVTLDGTALTLADANGSAVEPFAYQGTTYLPLRAVAGALGLGVNWDGATSTVALTTGGQRAASSGVAPFGTVSSTTIQVDYKDIKVTLDGSPLTLTDAKGNAVEPFAYQGTTYLPLRAVASALGLEVAWDAASATVALTTASTPAGGQSGGAGQSSNSGINAQSYIKGILDEWYLGVYTEQFLDEVGSTPERVQEIYLDSVQVEVDAFVSYVSIDYPEDVNDRLMEIWKKICAKASYTVGAASAPDANGIYTVPVTIRPLDIYKLLDEAFPAFSDEFEAPFADVDVDSMTEAEYNDWYANVYDKTYRDKLCDLLETLVPKMGYLTERVINVRVERDSDGYYGLNDDDNSTLADEIIPANY